MGSFPGWGIWGLMALGLWMTNGCQGGRKTRGQQEQAATGQLPDSPVTKDTQQAARALPEKPGAERPIPPGTCRIIGKIAAVLPHREADPQAPCGQLPCQALVQVQRVVGYGAAFQPVLVPGQEIKVYFTFTLSPTEKYFPELNTPLPGLQPGNVFEADVSGPPEQGKGRQGWFKVNTYQVR